MKPEIARTGECSVSVSTAIISDYTGILREIYARVRADVRLFPL